MPQKTTSSFFRSLSRFFYTSGVMLLVLSLMLSMNARPASAALLFKEWDGSSLSLSATCLASGEGSFTVTNTSDVSMSAASAWRFLANDVLVDEGTLQLGPRGSQTFVFGPYGNDQLQFDVEQPDGYDGQTTVREIINCGSESEPTNTPVVKPTKTPVVKPSKTPSQTPESTATTKPTNTPTDVPTNTPTTTPTDVPTNTPTNTPTDIPTNTPTTTSTPSDWDKSSVRVTGQCLVTGQAQFTVTNTGEFGEGNMDGPTTWRLYVDGALVQNGTLQLQGGESLIMTFGPYNGLKVTLEVDQRPGHPGHSLPQASLTCSEPNTSTPVPTTPPGDKPTLTPTNTPTNTPTSTPTHVPTSTPTNTPTSTPTDVPTSTPTNTPTSTPTDVPTSTPTNTPTPSEWDKTSVRVTGQCMLTGLAQFTVTNTGDFGEGDMDGPTTWRFYVDDLLTQDGTLQLKGGESVVMTFGPYDGQKVTLKVDQRPLHPGSSQPQASLTCSVPDQETPVPTTPPGEGPTATPTSTVAVPTTPPGNDPTATPTTRPVGGGGLLLIPVTGGSDGGSITNLLLNLGLLLMGLGLACTALSRRWETN